MTTAKNNGLTRIDFAFGVSHRLEKATQVAYKHFLAQQPLIIFSTETKRSDAFSKRLWAIEDTAFVPHEFVSNGINSQCLIQITADSPEKLLHTSTFSKPPWLLNLDLQLPPNYTFFSRVLEIVSQHEQDLKFARQRWKLYQADQQQKAEKIMLKSFNLA